jgi:hypothetical protein
MGERRISPAFPKHRFLQIFVHNQPSEQNQMLRTLEPSSHQVTQTSDPIHLLISTNGPNLKPRPRPLGRKPKENKCDICLKRKKKVPESLRCSR